MIVRHFISWIRTAPAGERAEATRSLARAWLISDLTADDRAAAEGALLMQLDDASPLVRQAMAEVFARSGEAPAAIVQALSLDQASVALPVLEHSPLLIDADLVDLVATGNCAMQCAIARRVHLPASVCAAIAEVGSPAAALELIENAYAELAPFSWDRIVERHGHLAAIRESMLVLEDLPAATRMALVAKLSDTLAQFVVARNWLSADRAGRIASEARDRSTVNIAARSRGDDMRGLVRHLRATGQLTAGLILRALLSGNLELFDSALSELSGLPQDRVSGLLHDRGRASLHALLPGNLDLFNPPLPELPGLPQARVSALLHARGGASLQALLIRAGLPESTFAAFRVALEVSHETGYVDTVGGAARLRRRMVERVLTRCETDRQAAEPLLILLRRFATESAREEARMFCDELIADEAIAPIGQELIAA